MWTFFGPKWIISWLKVFSQPQSGLSRGYQAKPVRNTLSPPFGFRSNLLRTDSSLFFYDLISDIILLIRLFCSLHWSTQLMGSREVHSLSNAAANLPRLQNANSFFITAFAIWEVDQTKWFVLHAWINYPTTLVNLATLHNATFHESFDIMRKAKWISTRFILVYA